MKQLVASLVSKEIGEKNKEKAHNTLLNKPPIFV
jgi:hypothetical protein